MDDALPLANEPLPDEKYDEVVDDFAHADDLGEVSELDPDLIDQVFAVSRT
jgi:hypothetical protein